MKRKVAGASFIIMALLLSATEVTHGLSYYSQCQLYYPTKGYMMDNPVGEGELKCYMRVWGDGNHVIPG